MRFNLRKGGIMGLRRFVYDYNHIVIRMRSDDIINVMYREIFQYSVRAHAYNVFSNSEKTMQGNKIRRQIAFAELRSATSSVEVDVKNF
ncbi:hypothetical protein AVEN_263880-1 [Araneus ventricosus]|uniref:Uncharacterized protein n=1 Tax=Araneus ventricosus TaxID=182803 RepID=A0A4Y2PVH9_ARAVE|nr:hypothetical protein AVEN_263880-1 [Araneus ventricosus]